MPPVDKTPSLTSNETFQLVYSLKAFDKIPVHEYISTRTGLTVVIAEVDGPVVNGYFCLVTEAFDDDGLPHTLEHLIFLGSEDYPYKGVLDLVANRCLASGTNAWTDIDHTCYTMETAGSEGFLSLMPMFLEHILYPVLADEHYVTEVHHVSPDGTDAGVVYCEMQGRENSAESLLHLNMARAIYPGHCGYSSETGGIMKNLRDSTSNTKVRNYHKEFYRPENLKIVITGQVKPEDVFKSLEKLEMKILAKGERGPFQRPWQNPVPEITGGSKDLIIKYPTDDENNGLFAIAWRGPSSVKDLYTVTACSLLLKYLTEYSVSPLPKEFVEIEDPYASQVSYNLYENSETCLYITFQNVPVKKLPELREKLQNVLKTIADNESIDIEKLHSIINRYKLESLSNIENSPHHAIAFMIIGYMLYGNTEDDLQQRINPLKDLQKLISEPKSYWLKILKDYFINNTYIAIQCYPSKGEQLRMAEEEKQRIDKQKEDLGEEGLLEKAKTLEDAIEFNDREPPPEMINSVPIPSLQSISFHNITRFSSKDCGTEIDLSKTPVFTYFDSLNTNFVYMFALLDTSEVPSELRLYLPILLESLMELPVLRDGKLIPYEEVVAELNDDTVANSTSLGLEGATFKCGNYSQTVTLSVQVESSKYEMGIKWLRDLLYNSQFIVSRLKVIALKMINSIAQAKREGRFITSYIVKELCYKADSNIHTNSILIQGKFLNELVEKLDGDKSQEVLDNLEKLRGIISKPSNVVLYLAGNLNSLENPIVSIQKFLPDSVKKSEPLKELHSVPDYTLLKSASEVSIKGCLLGMGCLESSFFVQCVKGISSFDDPDLPVLMLYLQYLIQMEGPLWKQVRGKGYTYSYSMVAKANEGLTYLVFSKATNVVGAYKQAKEILTKQIQTKEWDSDLLDSAKSSLTFKIIDEEKTIGNVVALSVSSYFQGVDYQYNRKLLGIINTITEEDLNRVGEKYVAPFLCSGDVRTAVVTDPAKLGEISEGFKSLGLDLNVYPSLEESFLNV